MAILFTLWGRPSFSVVCQPSRAAGPFRQLAAAGQWRRRFSNSRAFSSNPTSSTAISVGDINGDDWPDLVLYDWGYSNTIYILLNGQYPYDRLPRRAGGRHRLRGDGKGGFALKDNF